MWVLRSLGLRRIPEKMGSPNNNNNNNSNNISLSDNINLRGSERLWVIAQHLRQYKTPNSIIDQILRSQIEEEEKGSVGFAESTNLVNQRFRFKRAAVLVCLFENDQNDLRVILTRRSSTLSTHSGEISLPGGKAEEGDANDAATATREAKEEIGLDPSLVNVVTVLEPFLSTHLLRVTPVIGILSSINAFNPTPNAGEVDEIFDAPLEMFIKDENRRSEEREWMGYKYIIHYFDFENENKKFLIWGLTAGILIRAASVVYQRPPAFKEQYP